MKRNGFHGPSSSHGPHGPLFSSSLRSFVIKLFLPFLLVVWCVLFMYLKYEPHAPEFSSQDPSLSANKNGRGNRKFGTLFERVQGSTSSAPSQLRRLIMVPGHAVMNLEYLSVADSQDEAWYLLSYQRGIGFPSIISQHIHTAAQLALANSIPPQYKPLTTINNDKDIDVNAHISVQPHSRNDTVLIFSGGQTRKTVGPTSEAASYYYLAQHKHWLELISYSKRNNNNKQQGNSVAASQPDVTVYLEEYARDSFENLLFSICRFREATGYYPEQITVVGFDFKAERYQAQHRKAIGWPEEMFEYIGLKPPDPKFDHNAATAGELEAQKSFEKDPYGCGQASADASLVNKRNLRNPFHRTIPYVDTEACPEMHDLMHWCGLKLFDFRSLPWARPAGVDGRTLQ